MAVYSLGRVGKKFRITNKFYRSSGPLSDRTGSEDSARPSVAELSYYVNVSKIVKSFIPGREQARNLPKPVPHRQPIISPQIVAGFWGRSAVERARPSKVSSSDRSAAVKQ